MFQLSVTKHLDDPRSCKLDHWEIMVILPWVNQLWLPSGNLTLLNAIEIDLLKWWFSIAIMITTYDPWDLQGPCIISQPQSVHTESGWPGRPVSPQSWGWSRSACPRYCRPTSPPENSPLGTRVSFFFRWQKSVLPAVWCGECKSILEKSKCSQLKSPVRSTYFYIFSRFDHSVNSWKTSHPLNKNAKG